MRIQVYNNQKNTWEDHDSTNIEEFNDSDYRRGYTHGYLQALEDLIERGFSAKEVTRFFDGPLWKWRCENIKSLILPPVVERDEK